jgi:type VI secretion system secreted protein Hcp
MQRVLGGGGVVLSALVLLSTPAARAADEIFLQLPGVAGDSAAVGFEGAIDVQSFSGGGPARASDAGAAVGAGAAKATFRDLVVKAPASRAGPTLFGAAAAGTRYPTAVLSVRTAGEAREPYLTITLSDASVTGYSAEAPGGGARPLDTIALDYARVQVSYRALAPDGSFAPPIVTCWDVRANAACGQ